MESHKKGIDTPLVSVIVPIYNTEKYLDDCLKSLSRQTYKNLEIILVNDGSTDRSIEIMNAYAKKDSRFKCILCQENEGLFHARLKGVDVSSGNYIAFVDSDDTIGIDWFRLLVKKAQETNADIVMGNTICEDENKNKYIYNAYYFSNKSRECIYGTEIFDFLIDNEGMCFSKHTVWNKLYSRKIWDKSIQHYRKINPPFTMTEDIAFSTVLYYYAEVMAFSNHDGYFYYRNNASSTIAVDGLKKLKKNITDLKTSFSFVKSFLEEKQIYEKYEHKYNNLKNRYFRWWSPIVENNTKGNSEEEETARRAFLDFFEKNIFEYPIEDDDFFTDVTTTWNAKYEEVKKLIVDKKTKYVSFDIFDTLVVRPFLEPTDLYYLMEAEFKKFVKSNLSFRDIRMSSERNCRKHMHLINPNWQDVTLEEIYKQIGKDYSIAEEICRQLMIKEEELEIRFCSQRSAGKELYELAYEAGKNIILISDMYLSESCVNEILKKNGYTMHSKMYLSSSVRKLKHTGDLFRIALHADSIKAENMIHIGDNWNVDYLEPQKLGCKSFFFPKTKDILFNSLGDSYTGEAINATFNNINAVIDASTIMKNPAVRTLYALVANEIFDNPFVSFNPASNYNRDAYFIGYFPVGMHLLGLGKWMSKELKDSGYHKIHFIARDGYLPQKIYKIIQKYEKRLPESDYIYASRKSMISATIRSPLDLYNIKNNCSIYNQTPRTIYTIYSDVLKPLNKDVITAFQKEGIFFDDKFTDEESFMFFIGCLIKIGYDEERAGKNYQICCKYFKNLIGKNDITFDLGYSGKLQSAICKTLGYPIDVLYLHTNGYEANRQAAEIGYNIKSYYNFDTPLSGIVNEFIFSDYSPSCIKYEIKNDMAIPVFEQKEIAYQEKFLLDEIARGCENFVIKFYETFQDYLNLFEFRIMDTSLAYERFLSNSKWFDINLLKHCYLEDEYYGGISKKRLSDHWWWQINNRCILMPQQNAIKEPLHSEPVVIRENTQSIDPELSALYQDGVFVAAFKKINKWFPNGTKRRKFVKKAAKFFVK